MNTRTRRWLVMLPSAADLTAVHVVLTPMRSIVDGVRLVRLDRSGREFVGQGRMGMMTLEFGDLRIDDKYLGELVVSYQEDAPQIAEIAWEWTGSVPPQNPGFALPLDHGGYPSAAEVQDFGAVTVKTEVSSSEEALLRSVLLRLLEQLGIPITLVTKGERKRFFEKYETRLGDIHVHRRMAMEMDERARRFFLALDVGTMAPDLPEEWRENLQFVNVELATRVEMRALFGRSGCVPLFQPSNRLNAALREVSTFVQGLVLTHLHDPAEPKLFEWAFQRFAMDRIAVTHPDPVLHALLQSHGAPNGEAFFRFAELALTCIGERIHRSFWIERLEALARLAHAYAEYGSARDEKGTYVYAYREGRRFPARRLGELEGLYARPAKVTDEHWLLRLEDLFTSMVSEAIKAEGTMRLQSRKLETRAPFERQDPDRAAARSVGALMAWREATEIIL